MTLDERLGRAVRQAAEREGKSVSAWLADAAAERLRNTLLGEALDRWEEEHGAFSEAELVAAEQALELYRAGGRSR